MSLVEDVHARLGLAVPASLTGWDDEVDTWCGQYHSENPSAELSEINIGSAVFLFDHYAERVALAYAVSTPQLHPRDRRRMRGFPDVNIGVRAVLGSAAFQADRGHFLGHASGGKLDINLFPHRRALNRGWEKDGRLFRSMERHAAEHPGCFFYHRPVYDDATWIPADLEYGVLRADARWWRQRFHNKIGSAAS